MQQGEGAREGRHECTMTPRSDSQSSSRSDSALPRVTSCAQLSMCWQTAALGWANAPSTWQCVPAHSVYGGAAGKQAGRHSLAGKQCPALSSRACTARLSVHTW